MSTKEAFYCGGTVGSLLVALIAYLFPDNSRLAKSAISAGVARYEVNPTNGKVSFVWITSHLNQVTK